MSKGELVGILLLKLMLTRSWCFFSYAYVNLMMMMYDKCLVVALFGLMVLLVSIHVNILMERLSGGDFKAA